MGAHTYCYYAPYDADTAGVLNALQEREFRAGWYDPALRAANPPTRAFRQFFPVHENFPSPGAQHRSIEEARASALESGTGSILDILGLATSPQFLHASPSTHETLVSLFGHPSPTRKDVETRLLREPSAVAFWNEMRRGHCRYFVVYGGSAPSEVFFAGLSVD